MIDSGSPAMRARVARCASVRSSGPLPCIATAAGFERRCGREDFGPIADFADVPQSWFGGHTRHATETVGQRAAHPDPAAGTAPRPVGSASPARMLAEVGAVHPHGTGAVLDPNDHAARLEQFAASDAAGGRHLLEAAAGATQSHGRDATAGG
jgi:hypothetical protein